MRVPVRYYSGERMIPQTENFEPPREKHPVRFDDDVDGIGFDLDFRARSAVEADLVAEGVVADPKAPAVQVPAVETHPSASTPTDVEQTQPPALQPDTPVETMVDETLQDLTTDDLDLDSP